VARAANGWLTSSFVLPPEDAMAALHSIRVMADDHGRRHDSIEYAYNVTVFVGNPRLAQGQGAPRRRFPAALITLPTSSLVWRTRALLS
jgi:alkanesulfonate monooxygenase SsuD/methylene tetrahydromethanopterin reductase-like flavin-dependent oxidoreductase (luciferase family)